MSIVSTAVAYYRSRQVARIEAATVALSSRLSACQIVGLTPFSGDIQIRLDPDRFRLAPIVSGLAGDDV
jgi:hypothetical protein